MSLRSPLPSYSSLLRHSGDAATRGIILANVLTLAFLRVDRLTALLFFDPSSWYARPWTLLTYPVLSSTANPFFLLLICYWLWVVGGSLERSWSTRYFIKFFLAITAVSAVGLWIGFLITRAPVATAGLFLPLSGLTVAWCYLNPGAVVYFFFVLPLQARHLAWITMAFVVFHFGQQHPAYGLLALTGPVAALYWVKGIPWADALFPASHRSAARSGRPGTRSFGPFEAIARWRRKRQFRRLWQESGLPEDDVDIPPR